MNEDIPEIPPEELDQAVDEDSQAQGRGPARRAAEQGVRDMERRLIYLNDQLRRVNSQFIRLGATAFEVRALEEIREKVESERREAEQRLAEYQTQLKGLN